MDKRLKVVVTIGVIIVLVAAFYLITKQITRLTGHTVKAEGVEGLVNCLNEKGIKFYGAYWCPHCQNQKALFGDFASQIYVECDAQGENSQAELCQSLGIRAYPTWIINDKLITGEKSLEQLEELSGCSI